MNDKIADVAKHGEHLEVVETPEALNALAERLMQEPRVAVDTEANSLYAYHEQVCLIQISIPGENYLIDPLALDDLSVLGPFFSSSDVEKIFHAADYDLIVLRRDFNFYCHNLFDTMWAARVLGWERVGLADILSTYFDVEVNKRYQRYNWGKRPLDPKALTYAWMDSYYLLDLREIQAEELKEKGRWEEAQEIFSYLCNTVELPEMDNPDKYFWRIKGAHDLPQSQLQALYKIFLWREHTAERMDRPPVKVMSNRRLLNLAQVMPRSKAELQDAGMTHRQINRFGDDVLKALRGSPVEVPPPPYENNERPPAAVADRYHTLKKWRKEVAQRRGVASDVILPNAVLWELAERPPRSMKELVRYTGIGPWRQENYGPDILKILQR